MSIDRFDLVKESFEKKPVPAAKPGVLPSEYFGELVFDRRKMAAYLDKATLGALLDCIDNGKRAEALRGIYVGADNTVVRDIYAASKINDNGGG